MKMIKNICLLVIMILAMTACVEKTPDYGNFPSKDVDFTYSVAGDQYTLDFYVVSKIQFNNISAKSGVVAWDFGDGETSTEANPIHKYTKAGSYKVKLTLDGVGTREYPILIYDIAPVLTVAQQSTDIVVINESTVSMNIELPNPENIICKYEWIFPEGTQRKVGDNWESVETWAGYSHEDGTIDYPGELRFKNIGSQKIEIQTTFDYQGAGERRLEDAYANVQVGCPIPCKTLYYAVKDGNIMAYKLVDLNALPEGTKVFPFDMGASSGSTPTTMLYTNYKEAGATEGVDWIFTLDCGKQYTYINDTETRSHGDGKITVMNADGSGVNTVITNVGGSAFNDPFQGAIYNNELYYTDRNTGICKIGITKRGEVEKSYYNTETGSYFVTNQQLGYYGRGISYGAIHTGLYIDSKGVFYWPKNYSGNGIYRFTAGDIKQTAAIPHPILLSGTAPRAFTVDETRKKMYVWMVRGKTGLNVFSLPELDENLASTTPEQYFAMDADPVNNTADEGLFVTQFAVDSTTGNVYFGFNAASTEKTYTTGIHYYNPSTNKVESLFGNKEKVYGITVCDTKSKLF